MRCTGGREQETHPAPIHASAHLALSCPPLDGSGDAQATRHPSVPWEDTPYSSMWVGVSTPPAGAR